MTRKQLGRRIRTLREARKMSQGEFARRVGRSQPTVSDWEAGNTVPTFENQVRIATALEITVDQLMRTVRKTVRKRRAAGG